MLLQSVKMKAPHDVFFFSAGAHTAVFIVAGASVARCGAYPQVPGVLEDHMSIPRLNHGSSRIDRSVWKHQCAAGTRRIRDSLGMLHLLTQRCRGWSSNKEEIVHIRRVVTNDPPAPPRRRERREGGSPLEMGWREVTIASLSVDLLFVIIFPLFSLFPSLSHSVSLFAFSVLILCPSCFHRIVSPIFCVLLFTFPLGAPAPT